MKKGKLLSSLAALALSVSMLAAPVATSFADEAGETTASELNQATANVETTTRKVNIHKMVMNNEDLYKKDEEKKPVFPAEHDGTKFTNQSFNDKFGTSSAEEVAGVAFDLWKLSEKTQATEGATVRTAKVGDVLSAKSLGITQAQLNEFVKEQAATLDIKDRNGAPKSIDNAYFEKTKELDLTTTDGVTVEFKDDKSEDGIYVVTENADRTTYNKDGKTLAGAKAVPFLLGVPAVTKSTEDETLHIYPKNTEGAPEIDKNFLRDHGYKEVEKEGEEKAGASVVDEDKSNVNDGAQYKNYQAKKARITAAVGSQIPYEVKTKIPVSSNYRKLKWTDSMTKGLKFNPESLMVELNGALLEEADYKLISDNQGFTLTLTQPGLDKVQKAAETEDAEIRLTYSAELTEATVTDNPEKNDIKLDYSNKPTEESEPEEGSPKDKKITVEKSWDATGDQTLTEADKTVTAVFTLQEKQDDGTWKDVDSHSVGYADDFTYTFENLDDDKTYRVVERVSGYEPEYVSFVDGKVVIVDKKDKTNPQPLDPTEPEVINNGKKFVKTNEEGQRLEGAEFVVKTEAGKYLAEKTDDEKTAANKKVEEAKAALEKAINDYNNLDAEAQTPQAKEKVDTAQTAYNKAFKEAGNNFKEVETKDEATVLKSNAEGQFEIKGLQYDKYKLEEKTAPEGYAELNKDVDFEIKEKSYTTDDVNIAFEKTDESNSAKQIKNRRLTIPQTGGIGSLIFIVAGLAIMGIAFVAMKKRNAVEA